MPIRGAHFATAVQAMSEYLVVATAIDGTIQVFNTGAERLLGYPADDVVGRNLLTLHDPVEIEARAAELGLDPGFEVLTHLVGRDGTETREWTFEWRGGRLGSAGGEARKGKVTEAARKCFQHLAAGEKRRAGIWRNG